MSAAGGPSKPPPASPAPAVSPLGAAGASPDSSSATPAQSAAPDRRANAAGSPILSRPSSQSEQPFIWAAGIEDTFIGAPHPATGRILDEYALTEHYERWEADLALLASLGVSAARYGIPWYRVCPRRGVYDWSWCDRVLERLARTHQIEPIVDLVHYGTPLWLERSFLDPDYPQHVAEFARAFAERYRGLCTWYTPLNEPRVNAWYAGRLGWWPPHARSWRGFAAVMAQICRGICLTQRAIAEVEPNAVFVHVDATDLYVPAEPADAALVEEARVRQELVFLALELVQGRVGRGHPLFGWLERHGIGEAELAWFAARAVRPDVVGYNMYPMFSRKVVVRSPAGGFRVQIRPCWTETLGALTDLYAERYAPIPVMVTETASSGSMRRRIRWIEDSVAELMAARARGVPVIGYTFWPLFSLVAWAYQKGDRDVSEYLLDMGLWDLRPGPTGLERVATPAVEAYRRAIAVHLGD
jgi:beta-glucosidase/6-phospho-beta-glucosidase/beta-galactosidase